MVTKRGSFFFIMKIKIIRFRGLAHKIFQFGAVIGWAVKPPRKTIRQPKIPVNKNMMKVTVFRKNRFLNLYPRKSKIRTPAAKTKAGVIYQGLVIFCAGA